MGKRIDESKMKEIKDMKKKGYSYEFISDHFKMSIRRAQEICESSNGHSVKVTGHTQKRSRSSVNVRLEAIAIEMIEKGYGNDYGKYMADSYGKKK